MAKKSRKPSRNVASYADGSNEKRVEIGDRLDDIYALEKKIRRLEKNLVHHAQTSRGGSFDPLLLRVAAYEFMSAGRRILMLLPGNLRGQVEEWIKENAADPSPEWEDR